MYFSFLRAALFSRLDLKPAVSSRIHRHLDCVRKKDLEVNCHQLQVKEERQTKVDFYYNGC